MSNQLDQSPVSAKPLLFPNGHRTTSDRLSEVRVYPERSPSLELVYVEIFEPGSCVYRGIVDLNEVGTDGYR